MKKSVFIVCIVMVAVAFLASCSRHNTCPAYRGSIAEAVEVSE